jgi:hypothetical protein
MARLEISGRPGIVALLSHLTVARAVEILGAVAGVAASFAISEPDKSVVLAGWLGFGLSNICLLYCHWNGRMPYLFIMQLAFLASSWKGILAFIK